MINFSMELEEDTDNFYYYYLEKNINKLCICVNGLTEYDIVKDNIIKNMGVKFKPTGFKIGKISCNLFIINNRKQYYNLLHGQESNFIISKSINIELRSLILTCFR